MVGREGVAYTMVGREVAYTQGGVWPSIPRVVYGPVYPGCGREAYIPRVW